MTTQRSILVAGATGKQGGALISAILSSPDTALFSIIALTRNSSSARAKSLAQKANVTILEGDLDDCPSIFSKIASPLYGVFSVQVPLKPKVEEKQGKNLIDAAAAFGVKQFVYTSSDRGGEERSNRDATNVPHFISKFNIERHLKDVAEKTGMGWTIIRPVAFMDNLTNDFLGKGFATMWSLNGVDSRLQLVSSKDIGKLTAVVFWKPECFNGKALSFAADDLTFKEADKLFRKVTGRSIPLTYDWVGSAIKWALHDQLGLMFKWFLKAGFGADPNEFKDQVPGMMNFEEWLRTESGFETWAK